MADLVVSNVAKEYPTRGEPLVVLRDISVELSVGENVAIPLIRRPAKWVLGKIGTSHHSILLIQVRGRLPVAALCVDVYGSPLLSTVTRAYARTS